VAGGALSLWVSSFTPELPLVFDSNTAAPNPDSFAVANTFGAAIALSLFGSPLPFDMTAANFTFVNNTAISDTDVGTDPVNFVLRQWMDNGTIVPVTSLTAFSGQFVAFDVTLLDAYGRVPRGWNIGTVSLLWGCGFALVTSGEIDNGRALFTALQLDGEPTGPLGPDPTAGCWLRVTVQLSASGAGQIQSFVPVQLTGCPFNYGYNPSAFVCAACAAGTYSVVTNTTNGCAPCPAHVVCPGPLLNETDGAVTATAQRPFADFGYWMLPTDAAVGVLAAAECPPGFCTTPPGVTRDAAHVCAEGRDPTSPLCGRCLPRYSEWFEKCIRTYCDPLQPCNAAATRVASCV
jgi:hypothetical protein